MANLLDSLIYAGVVLLILSQVVEKISTFIRNYLGSNAFRLKPKEARNNIIKYIRYQIYLFFKWSLGIILILDKSNELKRGAFSVVPRDQQPKIEFAITKLSLLVGFLLAFLFHADLFKIIGSGQPHTVLHWGNSINNLNKYLFNLLFNFDTQALSQLKGMIYPGIQTFFGCMATGFLLTFGSKFFHDLLEILYEIKRAKRNLEDERVYKSQDLDTLKSRLSSPFGDPVSIVLEQHKTVLIAQFKTIISIERVVDQRGESILEIYTTDNSEFEALSAYSFNYTESNGEKMLPKSKIKLIPDFPVIEVHENIHLYLGNQTGPTSKTPFNLNYGTLGFFALRRSDNSQIFVTCAHVIDADPTKISVEGKIAIWAEDDKYDRVVVGELIDFKMNSWMDAAVIGLAPGVTFDNYDPDKEKYFLGTRDLNWDDQVDIWVNGGTSLTPRNGRVYSHQNAVRIKYGAQIRTLYNLLRISTLNRTSVSEKGDSGAIVFDMDMNAVGMIVSGNEKASYAIPINRILTDLEIKLPLTS